MKLNAILTLAAVRILKEIMIPFKGDFILLFVAEEQ